MSCCYPEDCGEYAVTPVLVAPIYSEKYCEEEPLCVPCLPRCPKGIVYCCEKKPLRNTKRVYRDDRHDSSRQEQLDDYDHHYNQRSARSPPPRRSPAPYCCPPEEVTCKPVKTKYVIPCYRYEDGRIRNQPSVLAQRACEVAVGVRARRKPFVESSFSSDLSGEVHRYHSEDERGNCCYHFERKKPSESTCCSAQPHYHCRPLYSNTNLSKSCHSCHPNRPCQPCTSSPECQFVECVEAKAVNPSNTCCFYV